MGFREVLRRILMYVMIWVGIFLALCIYSVIKYWSVLVAVITSTIYVTFFGILLILLILGGIISMIASLFI